MHAELVLQAWMEQYGELSPTMQARFLQRSEALKLQASRESDVRSAIKIHQSPKAILGEVAIPRNARVRGRTSRKTLSRRPESLKSSAAAVDGRNRDAEKFDTQGLDDELQRT